MSYLPTDDKARKGLPIWQMITRYFPKAFREITRVCVANNVRYNPEKDPADINWARGKSNDQLGSSFRHMMEAVVDGKVFEDQPSPVDGKPIYILAENAWRALAALEIAIEAEEEKTPQKLALSATARAIEERKIVFKPTPLPPSLHPTIDQVALGTTGSPPDPAFNVYGSDTVKADSRCNYRLLDDPNPPGIHSTRTRPLLNCFCKHCEHLRHDACTST